MNCTAKLEELQEIRRLLTEVFIVSMLATRKQDRKLAMDCQIQATGIIEQIIGRSMQA